LTPTTKKDEEVMTTHDNAGKRKKERSAAQPQQAKGKAFNLKINTTRHKRLYRQKEKPQTLRTTTF
jgi:hypothetical protein